MLADIVKQAKALYPDHPMLLLLEIDSQPQDPTAVAKSLAAVEAALATAEPDNTYPLMVKGTILSQKVSLFVCRTIPANAFDLIILVHKLLDLPSDR
jgi:hypothetical protein